MSYQVQKSLKLIFLRNSILSFNDHIRINGKRENPMPLCIRNLSQEKLEHEAFLWHVTAEFFCFNCLL